MNLLEPSNSKKCPYCDFDLDEVPKRGKKCKSCNNKFAVRKDNIFFKSNTLTVEQASTQDDYVNGLQSYYSPKEIFEIYEELKGQNLSFNLADAIWRAYNLLVEKMIIEKEYSVLASIYSAMASILKKNKKPYFDLLQSHHEMRLQSYEETYKKVKLNVFCEDEKEQDGKVITIKDAFEKKVLPHKNDKCVCYYAPIRD